MSDLPKMPDSYDAWQLASPPEDDECDDCDCFDHSEDADEECPCSCHVEPTREDDAEAKGDADYERMRDGD